MRAWLRKDALDVIKSAQQLGLDSLREAEEAMAWGARLKAFGVDQEDMDRFVWLKVSDR